MREQEWERAVAGLRKWGDYAARHGVKLAFEPLNRFETDMINVVDQGLNLIADVGSSAVGLHLDTFHMHLEEKIRPKQFAVPEITSSTFTPAKTTVAFPEPVKLTGTAWRRRSLTSITSAVVIESFTPQVESIARAVCIWREIAPDQDSIAVDGLQFCNDYFRSKPHRPLPNSLFWKCVASQTLSGRGCAE